MRNKSESENGSWNAAVCLPLPAVSGCRPTDCCWSSSSGFCDFHYNTTLWRAARCYGPAVYTTFYRFKATA